MKLKGFTLAEVLITMTIIGVVAALTTPALFHNAGTAQVGPKLAKIKSTIENAHRQLMADEEIGNLVTLFMDIANEGNADSLIQERYVQLLGNYMRMERINRNTQIRNYYGNNNNLSLRLNITGRPVTMINLQTSLNRIMTFDTVEGANIGFDTFEFGNGVMPNMDRNDVIGMIFVDINGISQPNRLGKDIFAFIIQNSGMLIPFGSDFTNSENIYRRTHLWTNNCNPDSNPPVAQANHAGLSCTATIFENNLRVTYED